MQNNLPYYNIASIFISEAISDLKTKPIELKNHTFKETLTLFLPSLLENISRITYKTIVINYEIANKRKVFTNKKQEENISEYFEMLMAQDVQDYIYKQYPVLRTLIQNEIDTWTKQIRLLCNRYNDDIEEIARMFNNRGSQLKLKTIEVGLGDRHRGGNCVSQLHFENGNKLIYKPRNLSIDLHLKELITWITCLTQIDQYLPRTLAKRDYGWTEYITYSSCNTLEEICNYYYKLGSLLSILYVLEGTDFHYENIISHGQYPVLIDLESFFHPYFPIEGTETNQGIDYSVLRVGVLPNKLSLSENEGIDIGGITDVEGTKGILNSQTVEFSDKEGLKLIRKTGTLKGGKNIPLLNNKRVPFDEDLVDFFKKGFEKTYIALSENREELLKRIDIFKTDEIRVLFRDTIVYTHLLEESTHPKLLVSEEALEKHFQLLWVAVNSYPLAKRFIQYEIESLWKRDVPQFSTKVNSKDLWYQRDGKIENFFEKNGMETVKKKIRSINEEDLNRQLWIIDSSFKIAELLKNNNYETPIGINNQMIEDFEICPSDVFVHESIKIAEEITNFIYKTSKEASWLVFKPTNYEATQYEIAPAFYDLFTGMPGEILYFYYLHSITGDTKYREISEKALDHLTVRLSQSKDSIKPLGAFAGWGSIIYLFSHLGHAGNNPKHFEYIEQLFKEVNFKELIEKDVNYALIKGAAGFIVSTLKYYEISKSETALDLSIQAGDHLINTAIDFGDSLGWKIVSKVPLAGLGHGSSGIIYAFSKLLEHTNDRKYVEIIRKCLKYESNLFIPEQVNWRDCRDVVTNYTTDEICSTMWAHGAPGIGLVRIEVLRNKLLPNDIIENLKIDLEYSLFTTLKVGFGGQHILSNGDFGNIELLINYSLQYSSKEIELKYLKIGSFLVNQIKNHNLNLGNQKIFSLGFMTGATGIAYQLLRLAYPKKIPSILALSNPTLSD